MSGFTTFEQGTLVFTAEDRGITAIGVGLFIFASTDNGAVHGIYLSDSFV